MTGLIVRTDLAPDVDSICDLFDPKYKGKVTMLTELRDSVPMTLKCMGIDPDKATTEEWLAAVDKIGEAADSGQIRRFTGNDYIQDLAKGDAAFALGWSGDAVQLQKDNPNIKFVMPKEGCMLWSTSMEIPVGAPNPQAAHAFINYVYDPQVQADIAEYVNYVTPVAGVKEILAKRDPALARNQLIFPSEEYTATAPSSRCSAGAGRAGDRGVPERGQGLRRCARSRSPRCRRRRSPAIPRRRSSASPSARPRSRAVAHVQLLLLPELHLSAPPVAARRERRLRRRGRRRDPRAADRAARRIAREPGSGSCPARSSSAATAAASTTPPRDLPGGRAGRPLPEGLPVAAAGGTAPGDASSPSTSPTSAGSGWRSATTASSPRPSGSSPGWAPRWCCSRP